MLKLGELAEEIQNEKIPLEKTVEILKKIKLDIENKKKNYSSSQKNMAEIAKNAIVSMVKEFDTPLNVRNSTSIGSQNSEESDSENESTRQMLFPVLAYQLYRNESDNNKKEKLGEILILLHLILYNGTFESTNQNFLFLKEVAPSINNNTPLKSEEVNPHSGSYQQAPSSQSPSQSSPTITAPKATMFRGEEAPLLKPSKSENPAKENSTSCCLIV